MCVFLCVVNKNLTVSDCYCMIGSCQTRTNEKFMRTRTQINDGHNTSSEISPLTKYDDANATIVVMIYCISISSPNKRLLYT